MIGNLLKQLVPAFGRFIRYHTTRVFHRREKPGVPVAANEPTAAAAPGITATAATASAGTLSDDAGLAPEYERIVRWPCYRTNTPPQEVLSNELYRLWTTIPSGHKWTHYFPIYQSIFGPLRAEPLRILEIGIWHGASLKLWRQYFEHPKTVLVGIDVLSECMESDAPAAGIHVRIGSQADPAFLQRVIEEFGPFDLIIDDGSHHSSHIIASFN